MSPLEASGLSLSIPEQLTGIGEGRSASEPQGADFGEVLAEALSSANQSANTASHAAHEFSAGRRDDIHGTMLALSKADIELHLVGTVRNKVMDAFYELWRMQI